MGVATIQERWYRPESRLDRAMELALEEAREAARKGDVPVGAVVLWDGEVLSRAHNRREEWGDPLAHAECLALREAARRVGRWRLDRAVLVVTLEPCPMCMGAVLQARVPLVAYGAADPRAGAAGSLYDLSDDPRLNHRVRVVRGIREAEAARLLREFFRERRGGASEWD